MKYARIYYTCFLLIIMTFLLTACNVAAEEKEEEPAPLPVSLSEEELLDIVTTAAGVSPEHYLYEDFDHNGTMELFATLPVDYLYQIWYCNSDGTICEKVYESASFHDECDMTIISYEKETHAVINLYNMMGTNKKFTILALQGDNVVCLVPWHYGTAGADGNQQPCMTVEDYDGCYDAAMDMWLMHTWKQTWLTFDEEANTYREIVAAVISETEFLSFTNAADYLNQIRLNETKDDTKDISFQYFCRANGILHVQCFITDAMGNIAARYYTLNYEDTVITGMSDYPTDGIMQERLTGLY